MEMFLYGNLTEQQQEIFEDKRIKPLKYRSDSIYFYCYTIENAYIFIGFQNEEDIQEKIQKLQEQGFTCKKYSLYYTCVFALNRAYKTLAEYSDEEILQKYEQAKDNAFMALMGNDMEEIASAERLERKYKKEIITRGLQYKA